VYFFEKIYYMKTTIKKKETKQVKLFNIKYKELNTYTFTTKNRKTAQKKADEYQTYYFDIFQLINEKLVFWGWGIPK